ncbi:lysozyme family protein [Aneurinibacillus thermoaerophilus]|uniref:lysozyme family protein n=1 Tax=Aneurinibacillus thermoaerophilus TaxID=143495 RepID=UPI002E231573|nr:lysozyme family protein [Aneurinibacillus thermoaerophilus]
MERIKKWIGILSIMFGLFIMALLFTYRTDYDTPTPPRIDRYEKVKQYEPMLRAELSKYHLEEYTLTLLALMHQESRGEGGDPMQASESAGLPPNTINDPAWSIRQGIKHFNDVLTYGTKKKVDFPTVIQAYNMGKGYIDFIAAHGKKHTEELAKQYSAIQVKKEPNVYNCGEDRNNFRYPYCYGDFSYTTKVLQKRERIKNTMEAS